MSVVKFIKGLYMTLQVFQPLVLYKSSKVIDGYESLFCEELSNCLLPFGTPLSTDISGWSSLNWKREKFCYYCTLYQLVPSFCCKFVLVSLNSTLHTDEISEFTNTNNRQLNGHGKHAPFSLKLILAAESANFSPPTWCSRQQGDSPLESELSSSRANSGSGSECGKTDGTPVT